MATKNTKHLAKPRRKKAENKDVGAGMKVASFLAPVMYLAGAFTRGFMTGKWPF